VNRRNFITLLGGAAAAWPLAARAQQRERMRRIGVLMSLAADHPESQGRNAAFLQGLQELGWTVGRNVRIDYRWGAVNPERIRKYAAELLELAPDVILATGSPVTTALLQVTRSVPIKWLELLKEIVPAVKRAGVLRDATSPAGIGQFAAIQSVASSVGVLLTPVGVSDPGEIDRGVTAVARTLDGGLIVTQSGLAIRHRELIVALAARHRLPAVFSLRQDVVSGGLISYGPDSVNPYRRAAGYVDRILKGEKPADLPVQAPTKYELVINLKTAKALGLEVPPTLLARADEVIE
jgi:putative tryptophan/tyrosine transport system substrate-binding protein